VSDFDCGDFDSVTVSKGLLSQYMMLHNYLSHRSHRALTKNRALMTNHQAKPYAQKGTGRARHGSTASNIHRGGAVSHGPNGEKRAVFSMPKKMRKKAFYGSLSAKCRDGAVSVVDSIDFDIKKDSFKKNEFKGLLGAKSILVYDDSISCDFLLKVRNFSKLTLVDAHFLNIHDILSCDNLFIARGVFTEMLERGKQCI